MSSSTLVAHECKRYKLRSCGYNVEKLSELPEDILVDEILLRLPVKSLIRFTVVCKFWYDLIPSPNFKSLYDTSYKKKRVPFYLDSYSHSITTTDITLGFFDANVPLLKLTVSPRADIVRLVGCCNGIVCLSLTHSQDTFALWNRATRQSRLINLLHTRDAKKIYAGFFFDSVADSCKVVRATFSESEGTVSGILNIFTLNDNNKWRNKELPVPSRIREGLWDMSQVTCLSTCMYWIVTPSPYSHRHKYILCLDVMDEVFKQIIELPSADHVYRVTELFDYKGSLALFVCFDVWVLNDDCGGNWHKQLTLRASRPLGGISNECNDLVLLHTSPPGQFLLWDTYSGKTTEVIKRNSWTWLYPFFLYSESFASV